MLRGLRRPAPGGRQCRRGARARARSWLRSVLVPSACCHRDAPNPSRNQPEGRARGRDLEAADGDPRPPRGGGSSRRLFERSRARLTADCGFLVRGPCLAKLQPSRLTHLTASLAAHVSPCDHGRRSRARVASRSGRHAFRTSREWLSPPALRLRPPEAGGRSGRVPGRRRPAGSCRSVPVALQA